MRLDVTPSGDSEHSLGKPQAMPESDLQSQLEEPLTLLRSITERAYRPGQVSSQSQLREQFAHLKGALADVMEVATQAFVESLEVAADSADQLGEGGDTVLLVIEEVALELEESLSLLTKTLLGARTTEELSQVQVSVVDAEMTMEAALSRLMMALESLDVPELATEVSEKARTDEAADILEHLSLALEDVGSHLQNGEPFHLERALTHVDAAAARLRESLASSE